MKGIAIALTMCSLLGACGNIPSSNAQRINWGEMSASTNVANVAGIKSLIRPGIY